MTRKLDQASIEALKSREGCRLTAYQDTGGVWTIGWGETDGVTPGMTITQEQADAWFDREIVPFCECVEQSVKVALTDNQFGALVSFAYNVGASAFETSTLLKKLNKGDYASVPSEMLRWVFVNKIKDDGLVNRRNSEGGQWAKGAYVRGAAVTPDSPPPIWKNPAIVKGAGALAGAAASAASNITSDNVKSAAEAAQTAAQHWHQFGIVAEILSGILVLWLLLDHRKSS